MKAALGALCCWLALHGASAVAEVVLPSRAAMVLSEASTPPPQAAAWASVTLPDARQQSGEQPPPGRPKTVAPPAAADAAAVLGSSLPAARGATAWFRVEFDLPAALATHGWSLYLPYLHNGGRLFLNGRPMARIAEPSEQVHVRWERPHLLSLPADGLLAGTNVVAVRTTPSQAGGVLSFPRLAIGPTEQLVPQHDRRLFWVRTVPQISMVACLLVGLLMLAIWARRRDEVLYGLFGLITLCWGLRTSIFVVEALPTTQWWLWRTLYHAGTAGFVVLLALFALRFASIRRPRLAQALFAYWLIGPLAMLASAGSLDRWAHTVWAAGLIPIGGATVALLCVAARRQHSATSLVLLLAVLLALVAGTHDYLLTNDRRWLPNTFPQWTGHRVFLLHHAGNLLLVALGTILAARFIHTLTQLEDLNRTLEDRVAERERQLGANYEHMGALERANAVAEERALIMRDLHDGLGSMLFTSLARVERGAIDNQQMALVLRSCIADMRLALEALAPDEQDFGATLGNFLFRWETLLREAGVQPSWHIDRQHAALTVPPHVGLQLLRVLQEALTNVLKHAGARHVRVTIARAGAALTLAIEDDGCGIGSGGTLPGRGLANMQLRARRLGAQLDRQTRPGRTCITLTLPLDEVHASAATAPAPRLPMHADARRAASSEWLTGAARATTSRRDECAQSNAPRPLP